MKKITSIVLILLLLFETSGLKELVKMPLLIHHYFEHKATHPSDNFLGFIAKHYTGSQKSESAHDKKTDNQLPFKSADCFQTHVSAFIVSEHQVLPVVFDIKLKQYTVYPESALVSRPFDIWQPPKIV
jgi:hypothetical protein